MTNRAFRLCFFLFVLVALGACQASPPVGIPAPVSELLSVGNPDSNGAVKLTGAPGAVNGGALVTVNDVSQTSIHWYQKLILAMAYAGQNLQDSLFANPDGSFELDFSAQVGDTLEVFQTVDGETSPPTVLKIEGNVVNLEGGLRDLEVDSSDGSLWISSSNGAGRIYRLNFGEGLPASFPAPHCETNLDDGITRLAITESDRTGFVISPNADVYYTFSLDSACAPNPIPLPATPVDIAPAPVANNVLIALEGSEGDSIVSADGKGLNSNCNVSIVHPSGSVPHAATLLLAATSMELPRVFAVSRFQDNSHWVSAFNADVCPDAKQADIMLPDGVEPSGLAVLDSDRVLISDASHDQVLLVDFAQRAVEAPMAVGQTPMGIAVSINLNRAFVVNEGSNSLSAIDLDDFSVSTLTGVGLMPVQIGLLPNGMQAGILSTFDGAIHLTDLDF